MKTKLRDLEPAEQLSVSIAVSCINFEKITLEGSVAIMDCPTCDFQCGYPKTQQRRKRLL